LHRLPYLAGRGRVLCAGTGQCLCAARPDFIKAWIKSQPTGVPGRRQMPQFNFTDQQLDDLVEFLKYTNGINTNNWPPNIEG
jgi:nitric oxide reductase subunit C